MKDASGASMMDPKSQITRLFGISVLDVATHSYEDNLVLSLIREYPDSNSRALANVALNAYINLHDTPMLTAAYAARQAGNSPNTSLCAALSIIGPGMVAGARESARAMLDLFRKSGLADPADEEFDLQPLLQQTQEEEAIAHFIGSEEDERARIMLDGTAARGANSVFLRYLQLLQQETNSFISADAVLAAICCHLAWKPLLHKRLSVTTLFNLETSVEHREGCACGGAGQGTTTRNSCSIARSCNAGLRRHKRAIRSVALLTQ